MLGRPLSLRQQTIFYILAPVLLLLIGLEIIGFGAIKSMLVEQIQQTGVSYLQKTASHIDLRLRLPKKLLAELVEEQSDEVKSFLRETIESFDGVIELHQEETPLGSSNSNNGGTLSSNVEYARVFRDNTILLNAVNRDKRYEATLAISFFDLIGHIPQTPWWNGLQTYLLDTKGNVLSPVEPTNSLNAVSHIISHQISENNREKILQLATKSATGSLPGDNSKTPEIIYGFHSLKEAPYIMVVVSDATVVLEPLLTFRLAYLIASLVITGIILILLNLMANRIIQSTKKLSKGFRNIAKGQFGKPLKIVRDDEIGRLVQNFNDMSVQLQNGLQVQQSLLLAGEIQQSFLPQVEYSDSHLEAFGFSLPCDETGGDFFDIIPQREGSLFLIVGDVVGHGVGAALLMATTRALLRSEIQHNQDLASCTARVNSLLCDDTVDTGNFSTLFLLSLAKDNRTLRWVRAGHEPAMLYNVDQQSFTELRGKGTAIGIDSTLGYQEYSIPLAKDQHLIFIGSDGLTELENCDRERFGRKRLQQCIQKYASHPVKDILARLREEIDLFAGERRPDDDITAVIAKIR